MNDRGFPFDSGWDDGVYGTGSTQPPKSHRALLALLLVSAGVCLVNTGTHRT